MEAELFIKQIGEKHIIKIREVSDKIDKLSEKEKNIMSLINSKISTLLLGNLEPENHLLCIESNLVVIKYSQSSNDEE